VFSFKHNLVINIILKVMIKNVQFNLNAIILAFVLLFTASQISAQVIYADYETVTPSGVTAFSNCVYSVEANPDKSGLNTSNQVAKFITSTAEWDGIYWDFEGMVDFSSNKVFSMLVKSAFAGKVILKLEATNSASTNVEVQVNYSGSGNWELLTFDFAPKSPSSEIYGRMVIFMDAGAFNGGNDWFFDNIQGPEAKYPVAEPHDWELVWSDEFDYTGLPNSTKWNYDTGGGGFGNNELQYYTYADADNVHVDGEKLTITAKKEVYSGMNYTSARLLSKGKGDWLYGRVEVKAKVAGGRGSWPAIWMLPTDWYYGNWPASGEIDIMEYVGYDPGIVHGTVHTNDFNHTLGTQVGTSKTVADAETAFHVYALNWFEDKIELYVDEVKYFSFPYYSDWKKWPFNKRFHLIMNIAVGGNWGGVQGVDDTAFPMKMEVDYVRVYKEATNGIKDLNAHQDIFKIYPNPVNDVLKVDFLTENFSENSEIQLLSIEGRLIKQITTNTLGNELNISDLASGIYFVKVKANNRFYSEKIIKK